MQSNHGFGIDLAPFIELSPNHTDSDSIAFIPENDLGEIRHAQIPTVSVPTAENWATGQKSLVAVREEFHLLPRSRHDQNHLDANRP
jgi:hypothetical protein